MSYLYRVLIATQLSVISHRFMADCSMQNGNKYSNTSSKQNKTITACMNYEALFDTTRVYSKLMCRRCWATNLRGNFNPHIVLVFYSFSLAFQDTLSKWMQTHRCPFSSSSISWQRHNTVILKVWGEICGLCSKNSRLQKFSIQTLIIKSQPPWEIGGVHYVFYLWWF